MWSGFENVLGGGGSRERERRGGRESQGKREGER